MNMCARRGQRIGGVSEEAETFALSRAWALVVQRTTRTVSILKYFQPVASYRFDVGVRSGLGVASSRLNVLTVFPSQRIVQLAFVQSPSKNSSTLAVISSSSLMS